MNILPLSLPNKDRIENQSVIIRLIGSGYLLQQIPIKPATNLVN